MSLKADMHRASQLCDKWLNRKIGQYDESAEGRHGVNSKAVGLGRAMMSAIDSQSKGHNQNDIQFWIDQGKLEAKKSKTAAIRCNGSAALIAYLLSSNRGVENHIVIVSQGNPVMGGGHWFVVVTDSPDDPMIYPSTFPANSFVVDIWGAINADRNSSVVSPAAPLYNCGRKRDANKNCAANRISKRATGQGGYQSAKCCYLTTATCQVMGLPDDCEYLRVLRWFRDNVLSRTADGKQDIAAYYRTAPEIVAAIDLRTDHRDIYEKIFRETVQPAVKAIQGGAYELAYTIYRNGVTQLHKNRW